jgi:hypothetical protein
MVTINCSNNSKIHSTIWFAFVFLFIQLIRVLNYLSHCLQARNFLLVGLWFLLSSNHVEMEMFLEYIQLIVFELVLVFVKWSHLFHQGLGSSIILASSIVPFLQIQNCWNVFVLVLYFCLLCNQDIC